MLNYIMFRSCVTGMSVLQYLYAVKDAGFFRISFLCRGR